MSPYQATPRPAGGSRPNFSQMGESHLDDQAMQSLAQTMQQKQQGTSSVQATTGGSALKSMGSKQPAAQGMNRQAQSRPVGTLSEELIKYPLQDLAGEVKQFFDINLWLGINPADTPEEQMKKKQMLQRWNQLNEEQQAWARKRYQEAMKKKQQAEQEQAMKKQREEEAKAATIQMPSSPKNGPVGPFGSRKQKVVQQLQHDRQTISKVAGAN